MPKIEFSLSPRQIIGVSRALIVCMVLFGLGCLQTAAHPLAGQPLPLHLLTQTGAAALLTAFAASLAVAGYAAFADIDRPRNRYTRRR